MTAEHELAKLAASAGFLWAVLYMFLLAGIFGFGAWWLLKDTVRWVLCEPHLRWRRAGRLVGAFAAVGGLGALSWFLGGAWPLLFAIGCFLSSLVNVWGEFSGTARSCRVSQAAGTSARDAPAGRGENHG